MITIVNGQKIRTNDEGRTMVAELRGLSTDTKPTTVGDITIDNGSVFIEIDTGKIFFYDIESKTWKEA